MKRRSWAVTGLIAIAATGSVALAAAVPAAAETGGASADAAPASASQCEGGKNGFNDISDQQDGFQVDYFRFPDNGPVVSLNRYEDASLLWRDFAKIYNGTHAGDRVWMDWSQAGPTPTGGNWFQCGPFTVGANGHSKTSAAKEENPSPKWVMRACGDRLINGAHVQQRCTGWH
jgi:hypothetical protein